METDLNKHDKRFHPQGFDPKKDTCKLREDLAKADKADELDPDASREYMEAVGKERAAGMSLRDAAKVVLRAAKTINHHISAGDFSPNASKLNDLKAAAPSIMTMPQSKERDDLIDRMKEIAASEQNGFKDRIGRVDVPSKSLSQPSPSSSMQGLMGHSSNGGSSPSVGQSFDTETAAKLLARVAKSINHHIKSGDYSPNQGALSLLAAHETDIMALPKSKENDELKDRLDEIKKSAANGFKDRIGKVEIPAGKPSAAQSGTSGSGGTVSAKPPKTSSQSQPPSGVSSPSSGGGSGSIKPFSDGPSPYAAYLDGVNANHKAATDPNYFKNKADSLSVKDATELLEDKTVFANGAHALVKGGYHDTWDSNDPDEPELWSGWKPSKRYSDDTVKCAAVCFADLAERFPNTPWKDNLELRCGTKAFTGGQSVHTSDWRRHSVLFNCDYSNVWGGTGLGHGASNYGHSDARFPFDVLRHEMGHALISGKLPNGQRMITKWHDAMTKAYGRPSTALFDFARKYISHYAVTQKGNHGPSMAECLSECFSVATSPDYKPGYLPRPVEDFIFGEMLGVKI